MTNHIDVLEAAADIIAARGLHQGDYWPELRYDPASRVCTTAAIYLAAGATPDYTFSCLPRPVQELAWQARRALTRRPGIDGVAMWNDKPGRTAEQVVTELRACAAELREEARP